MKKQKEKRKTPKVKKVLSWNFDFTLENGETAKVETVQDVETIDRKCKIETGLARQDDGTITPVYKNMRENGKVLTAKITVPGFRVTVNFEDGTKLSARSCCKPPDIFCGKLARKKAIRRLFLKDDGVNPAKITIDTHGQPVKNTSQKRHLSGTDRKSLYLAILNNGKTRKRKDVVAA